MSIYDFFSLLPPSLDTPPLCCYSGEGEEILLCSPDSDGSDNLAAMDLMSPLSPDEDSSRQSDEIQLQQGMILILISV